MTRPSSIVHWHQQLDRRAVLTRGGALALGAAALPYCAHAQSDQARMSAAERWAKVGF